MQKIADIKNNSFIPLLIISSFAIIFAIPFLNQPFSIDDPFTIRTGQAVIKSPIRPYLNKSFWFDEPGIIFDEFKNPPLISYLSAIFISIAGKREIFFHSLFLIIFILMAWSFYFLIYKWLVNSVKTTIIFLSIPAIVIQSHHIMPDILCLMLFLSGLLLLQKAIKEEKIHYYLIAGLLGGFAGLTKYSGMLWIFISILFIHSQKEGIKKTKRQWLAPVLASVLPLLWLITSFILYGRGHWSVLFNVYNYYPIEIINKFLAVILHLGGNLFFLLFLIEKPTLRKTFFIAVLVFFISVFFISQNEKLPLQSIVLGIFFIFSSILLLINNMNVWFETLFGNAIFKKKIETFFKYFLKDNQNHKKSVENKNSNLNYSKNLMIFLSRWVLLGIISSVFFTPFMASRFLLLWLAPILIMTVKKAEDYQYKNSFIFKRFIEFALLGTICLGLIGSISDYQLSFANYSLAQKISEDYNSSKLRYTGHWGFQYYMDEEGFNHFNPLAKNANIEYIVCPENFAAQPLPENLLYYFPIVSELKVRIKNPFIIMNIKNGAGFYLHLQRPLPWTIAKEITIKVNIRMNLFNLNKI